VVVRRRNQLEPRSQPLGPVSFPRDLELGGNLGGLLQPVGIVLRYIHPHPTSQTGLIMIQQGSACRGFLEKERRLALGACFARNVPFLRNKTAKM